jgi:hypothetical protein
MSSYTQNYQGNYEITHQVTEPWSPKYSTVLMNFTYGRVERLNIEHRLITEHPYSARACWL